MQSLLTATVHVVDGQRPRRRAGRDLGGPLGARRRTGSRALEVLAEEQRGVLAATAWAAAGGAAPSRPAARRPPPRPSLSPLHCRTRRLQASWNRPTRHRSAP